jgi:hypothetical protein
VTSSTPGALRPATHGDSRFCEPEALWVIGTSNVLRAYDERTNHVTAELELRGPDRCRWLPISGGGLIWVFGTDGSVATVDPTTARLVMSTTKEPSGLLGMPFYAQGAMWIWGSNRLWRITESGQMSLTSLGSGLGGPGRVTAAGRWLFFGSGNRVIRVDPQSGAAKAETLPDSTGLQAPPRPAVLDTLEAGAAGVVAACGHNRPDIFVLDPDSMEVKRATRVPDRGMIVDLHRAGEEVWALSSGGTAMRVDGDDTGEPRTIRLDNGQQNFPAAAADDCLWVVDEMAQALARLDLEAGRISARIPIPEAFWDDSWFRVVAGRRTVWLISRAGWDFDGIFRVDIGANRLIRVTQPTRSTAGFAVVAAAPRPA